MMKRWVPTLQTDLVKPKHGGDLIRVRHEHTHMACQSNKQSGNSDEKQGQDWIDLSSAVNREPWPVPTIPTKLWHELPDQTALLNAAQSYYGVNECVNKCLAISGSQQAIEWLPLILFNNTSTHALSHVSVHALAQAKRETESVYGQAEKIVYVPQVGYQEHEFCWRKWDYTTVEYDTTQTSCFSTLVAAQWHVLVLIQPNNPNGHLFTQAQIKQLLDKAAIRNAFVIVDEAFIDSQPQHSLLSCSSVSTNHANNHWPESLILLRSIGKFFGLPGARVGFCFANQTVRTQLALAIGPWPISTPATWLVTQALSDQAWQNKARRDLALRREKFANQLQPKLEQVRLKIQEKSGQEDTSSWQQTDFFFTLKSSFSDSLFWYLKERCIHTRLGKGWIRFALPAHDEFNVISERLATKWIQTSTTSTVMETV
ncbi:aminotransferase class I/II-fold pyridoxal phosphate-dependent enzyme [Marinomonas agarivorans]|nr:aminotransferase class I/II-fold pyridoxal phosphate-dependent enzyme [Marinomonas agarivorans]